MYMCVCTIDFFGTSIVPIGTIVLPALTIQVWFKLNKLIVFEISVPLEWNYMEKFAQIVIVLYI